MRINGRDYRPGDQLGAQLLVVDRCTLDVQAFRYSDGGDELRKIYSKLFGARQDGGLDIGQARS